MSGKCFSSGHLTNKGAKDLYINPYLHLKIDSISLYVIPIALDSFAVDFAKNTTTLFQFFFHPALVPNVSHVAVQLNMENKDLFLIEYGQYLTKDSEMKSSGIFSSSNNIESSKNPNEEINDVSYYYINKDGVRISKFDFKWEGNKEELQKKLITQISVKYYGISVQEFERINSSTRDHNKFFSCLCKINNKITLRELFEHFKGKKEWEAQGYNVLTHNCQDFGAEIIKILKAERIDESLKVRTREKLILPNCIINAFRENEELSLVNTLGRIPILGLFHDIGYVIGEHFDKNNNK